MDDFLDIKSTFQKLRLQANCPLVKIIIHKLRTEFTSSMETQGTIHLHRTRVEMTWNGRWVNWIQWKKILEINANVKRDMGSRCVGKCCEKLFRWAFNKRLYFRGTIVKLKMENEHSFKRWTNERRREARERFMTLSYWSAHIPLCTCFASHYTL